MSELEDEILRGLFNSDPQDGSGDGDTIHDTNSPMACFGHCECVFDPSDIGTWMRMSRRQFEDESDTPLDHDGEWVHAYFCSRECAIMFLVGTLGGNRG